MVELATYRWGLPEDVGPVVKLIDALGGGAIDAVAFTSASQVANLFAIADQRGCAESLKYSMARTVVASIGPVCSSALRRQGLRVDVEAHPPKLGSFMEALNERLTDH